jgi:hypothetical protein
VFFQIHDPKNASIVEEAIAVSQKIHDVFPEVTISELKVEVAVRAPSFGLYHSRVLVNI